MIGQLRWGDTRFDCLVDNGDPAKRVDVAILGDGYAADEMHLFNDDVDRLIATFRDVEPIQSYWSHFNFYRVNTISAESGVSDRYANPPVKRRSALGCYYSRLSQRHLVGPDPYVKWVARQSGVPNDHLLVIVNTPRRGGATQLSMTVGYASRNSFDFPMIMVHEAGHSIAKLADEYTGDLPDVPLLKGTSFWNLLPFANVDMNGKAPKWSRWIDDRDTPLPTPTAPPKGDGIPDFPVGAFEGAFYTRYGVYKPTSGCKMRRHSWPFCPICQEQWIKRIYRKTAIADQLLPYYESGQPPLRLSADSSHVFRALLVRDGQHIYTRWRIKRAGHVRWTVVQESADYADCDIALPLSAVHDSDRAQWQVELLLEDRSSKLRKPDAIAATRQRHVWQIVTS